MMYRLQDLDAFPPEQRDESAVLYFRSSTDTKLQPDEVRTLYTGLEVRIPAGMVLVLTSTVEGLSTELPDVLVKSPAKIQLRVRNETGFPVDVKTGDEIGTCSLYTKVTGQFKEVRKFPVAHLSGVLTYVLEQEFLHAVEDSEGL